MHAIQRPKFIIKLGELFSQINQFISRLPNFIALNLKEKSMRYNFFSKSMHWNLKNPRKNSGRQPLHEAFKSRQLRVDNVPVLGLANLLVRFWNFFRSAGADVSIPYSGVCSLDCSSGSIFCSQWCILNICHFSNSHPSVFQNHSTNSMFSLKVGIDSWPGHTASLHLCYYFWSCQPICSNTASVKHCSHTALEVFGLLILVHLNTTKIRSLHTTLLWYIQQEEWSYWQDYNNTTSDHPRLKWQQSWPIVSTQLAALPTKQKCKQNADTIWLTHLLLH